ncbi:MAG TPA: RNA polymerase sigma-54 factor [Lachnospiraceae bacterium]|nr:RNA polymerase sigma-54 factor [Lachnospiraceae bacterium]
MSERMEMTKEQKQLLSQTHAQSLKLLGMCNTELYSFLNNEYLENPLFEHTGGSGEPGVTEEFESWYPGDQEFNDGYGDSDKVDPTVKKASMAEDADRLRTCLKDQLNVNHYTKAEWELIDFLILNLEDSGFYPISADETARISGASAETVRRCLDDLRELEPVGIFAENMSECLLKQVEALGVEDEALTSIIRSYLNDALHGRLSKITRGLGISSVTARKYIAFIRTLNPMPLSGFYSGKTSYVIPDVLFEEKDDQWDISLNDGWLGEYHLNEFYLQMLSESTDEELLAYFQNKLKRAQEILEAIDERKKTILQVSKAVLEWQKGYFEEDQKPVSMTLAQAAQKLNLKESTVRNAVSGKYIQHPKGTVLMEKLFV